MTRLLIIIAFLLTACQDENSHPVRVDCQSAGGHLQLEFDRVEKTPAGLRAWLGEQSAILDANCVVVK